MVHFTTFSREEPAVSTQRFSCSRTISVCRSRGASTISPVSGSNGGRPETWIVSPWRITTEAGAFLRSRNVDSGSTRMTSRFIALPPPGRHCDRRSSETEHETGSQVSAAAEASVTDLGHVRAWSSQPGGDAGERDLHLECVPVQQRRQAAEDRRPRLLRHERPPRLQERQPDEVVPEERLGGREGPAEGVPARVLDVEPGGSGQ